MNFKRCLILLLSAFCMYSAGAQFKWPNGAKAAVVFTYDDALDGHLDVAVPHLDEFGLKGTFYCTGYSQSLYKRLEDWRAIAQNGHELGNHTLFHPCDGKKHDWVKPEYDLNKYTLEQILTEIRTANTLLKGIDGKEKRTFGYTCSNFKAGDEDFSDDIQDLVVAARCGSPIPKTMKDFNIYKAPGQGVNEPDIRELIGIVEEARKNGTIAVFVFHSVGGGYLNVGADEHRELLRYVAERKEIFYTGTFLEVMEYVKQNPEN